MQVHPGPAPPSHAGAAAPLPVPGAGIQAGTHPGPHPSRPRTHSRRHPLGPVPPRGAPTPTRIQPGPTPTRTGHDPRRARPARTYPGRRSRRIACSPVAAAAPGRPFAAPWPWPRCCPPAMPGPGPERPPRRARAPRRLLAARGPAPSWAASARAPVPHSCRRARLRRRRRWCLRRGRRACAGAGPGAHGALWPARPAGGPQRRGRAGGLLPRPTRPPACVLRDQP